MSTAAPLDELLRAIARGRIAGLREALYGIDSLPSAAANNPIWDAAIRAACTEIRALIEKAKA